MIIDFIGFTKYYTKYGTKYDCIIGLLGYTKYYCIPIYKILLYLLYQLYTRWCPPSYKLVIILVTIDISPINHSEIGLMFTNLANELGHHPVPIIIVYQLYTNYIGFTK